MEGSFADTAISSMDAGVIGEDRAQVKDTDPESDVTDGSPVAKPKKAPRKRILKKKRPLRKLDGAVLKQRIGETQRKIQLLLEKTEGLQVKLRAHEEEANLREA